MTMVAQQDSNFKLVTQSSYNMKNIILLLGILAVITSCQTMPYQPYARDVKKKPQTNGTIALKPDHRDEDRAKADAMMKANCGKAPVRVLEEGEVVIGQESTTNANTAHHKGEESEQVGSFFGMPVMAGGKDPSQSTTAKVSTTQVKEWQINYECVGKKSVVK
jgi:hypothetical protein